MPQTLKKQALTLTIANGFTRGLGFLFRLMTARLMGAEAIGVMELSASAAMLALTPATAGLPTAMSRMTARPNADQHAVLRAGLSLNRRMAHPAAAAHGGGTSSKRRYPPEFRQNPAARHGRTAATA